MQSRCNQWETFATRSIQNSTHGSSLGQGFTWTSTFLATSISKQCSAGDVLQKLACTECVALTSRCRRYLLRHGIVLLRLQFLLFRALKLDRLGQLGANCLLRTFSKSRSINSRGNWRKNQQQAHITNIVLLLIITTTLSVPLTLFNLCLLFHSHCRRYV